MVFSRAFTRTGTTNIMRNRCMAHARAKQRPVIIPFHTAKGWTFSPTYGGPCWIASPLYGLIDGKHPMYEAEMRSALYGRTNRTEVKV